MAKHDEIHLIWVPGNKDHEANCNVQPNVYSQRET